MSYLTTGQGGRKLSAAFVDRLYCNRKFEYKDVLDSDIEMVARAHGQIADTGIAYILQRYSGDGQIRSLRTLVKVVKEAGALIKGRPIEAEDLEEIFNDLIDGHQLC